MFVYFFILAGFRILVTAADRRCDYLGILVYEDMHCTANFGVKGRPGGCPTSYECSDIKKSDDTCYFRGNSVAIGDGVNASMFCNFGCICNNRTGMEFNCANFQCRNHGPPPPPGCYHTFNLKKCCGSLDCPDPNKPVHKCTYEGVEYREGERFVPKTSCSLCLCQKGFSGKIEEPYCIPQQCETQLYHQDEIQKSCAPVYTRQDDIKNRILCCPTFYTCPDGQEEIIESHSPSWKHCKFGEKIVAVGQQFKKQAKDYQRVYNVTCTCNVPPLVTCIDEPGISY